MARLSSTPMPPLPRGGVPPVKADLIGADDGLRIRARLVGRRYRLDSNRTAAALAGLGDCQGAAPVLGLVAAAIARMLPAEQLLLQLLLVELLPPSDLALVLDLEPAQVDALRRSAMLRLRGLLVAA